MSRGKDLRELFLNAPSSVVPLGDGADVSRMKIERRWRDDVCQSHVVNQGREAVRLKEVVLFDLQLPLPATTKLYGEGFQMLSQTGGTLGQPTDLGNYTDAKHYKLPAPSDSKAFYGMMMLSPSPRDNHLLAFTSCRRFIGQFYLSHPSLKVLVDTEGGELRPGESWQLEPFIYQSGSDREQLLDSVWGRDVYIDERTVDVHVGRLRKAIGMAKGPDPIRTVRGSGYAFNETPPGKKSLEI